MPPGKSSHLQRRCWQLHCLPHMGLSHLGPREGRSQARLSHVPVAMQNISKEYGKGGQWWLVHSRKLRCGRFLCPLWTSRGPRRMLFELSWIRGDRRKAFSTSWSGRGS
ncbi:uncharacterized protein ACWYII_020567 isoform 1-T1 [Salvelinus alpinus]